MKKLFVLAAAALVTSGPVLAFAAARGLDFTCNPRYQSCPGR